MTGFACHFAYGTLDVMQWAKQTHRGFTIVELLIVIVVIAILAAITIVAYNGIQTRAKAASTQSVVSSVIKKVEIYRSETGQMPTQAQLINNQSLSSTDTNSGPVAARLDGLRVVIPQPNSVNGDSAVRYIYSTTSCAWIDWWDFTNNRITTLSTTPSSTRIGC